MVKYNLSYAALTNRISKVNNIIKEIVNDNTTAKPVRTVRKTTTTEYKMLLDAKIKGYNSPYKTGDTYKFKEIEVIND
jgi:uncharacterized protein (UPF0147 family)